MVLSPAMTTTPTLAALLENFARVHVMCIGDVMLDPFVYGTVERISPEAPIPVLRVNREVSMLGGAGNVVRNAAALGARATLVAPIGDDEPGAATARLIAGEKGLASGLVVVPGRQTTQKVRHIAGNQQMLRADRETASAISAADENRLCETVEARLEGINVVILSDYAKGTLTSHVIERVCAAARVRGIPVLADPKNVDFNRYKGASILTPNARELAAATGMPVGDDASAEAAATAALAKSGLDAILVTRSERGMTLARKGAKPVHFATLAREVYDVSGAGDTVIATFAIALGAGASLEQAAMLANTAAGVVVGKSGTAVVRPDELSHALHTEGLRGAEAKLRTLDGAQDIIATWRTRDLRIGFTNGCFDLLHPGHVSLLKQARAACDRLVVGLNTDASVSRLKGPTRPINSEGARAIVLAALETVDLVVLFDDETPIRLIEGLRPDILVKGADYTIDQVVGAGFVQSYGGSVVLADLTPGQSTTRIVERMATPSA
jgi:D-beta-D-heptose 7-phosphate kinase/D-beta-D-heptose 1-phosphate adenosyltransferase